MASHLTTALGKPPRHVRAATMMGLRWLAIGGQLLAVLVTAFGLRFTLPLVLCLLVIAASVALNIVLRLKVPLTHRFEDQDATLLLAYDIVQLTLLLYLTGGLGNPFSMLFLGPLMISAVSLSPSRTLLLGLLTGAAATLLVRVHQPLPWMPGQHLDMPPVFSLGTWMAVVIGAGFVGLYASRVAEEARQLADALAATELVLAREQHLTQLDGLAAAAAHELGTPLATITLVIKELMRGAAQPGGLEPQVLRDDLALLDQESSRCRVILGKLTSLNDEKDGPLERMALSHLIEEVISPHRHFGVALSVVREGQGGEPVCARNPGLLYGLGNLVENAIDYARAGVVIESRWDASNVGVTITDDGPGFSPDVLARLGEPYLSSKGQDRRAKTEDGSGLGLGLFIAKTLLERSGASLDIRNASAPATGAIVAIDWPREAFERDGALPTPTGRYVALQALQGL
ncbi:ActS/PrrB/RegB family redox-sensitive histidine kinase [Lichenihabitans sp. Uapishka_5]|uniref:ActS/PrrB/RegB family redox-sensitive histidine kinase n=1 Tax=Lichenihabitans sp. Uapishka_5 TaxID=3037302 RepID=UPI0029E7F68B|nr:ActS/PrrB/RegB family redox-sensitive histidine kinase [Lichenihabitans sp. Uapishka_5]MDX7951495.1 ActS/PrrB/RegB family redox-sensitive histidine kinase [Lichenihabitans sp. Uapishka_5]